MIVCKRQLRLPVQGFAFLLFGLLASALQSQEANTTSRSEDGLDSVESLAPVYVRAKQPKIDSLSEVNLEHYTGFARVVERSQFEGRFGSLPDQLKNSSALQLRQAAGLGSDAQISLRGSKSKQVNVFLDGLLLNSPFYGTTQLQSIPVSLIESLEVYPDFTPLVLSHANLSGALNIKSRQLMPEDTGAELSLASGSFGAKAMELSSWGAVSDWQSMLGISAISADNDYPVAEDAFRSTYPKRQNDAFQAEHVFLKAGKDFSTLNVQMMGQLHQHEKEIATIKNWQSDAAFVDADSERFQLLTDYASGLWKFSHRFSYAAEDNLFNDEDASIGLGRNKLLSKQDNLGLFSIADVLIDEHQVMFSLDLREDQFHQRDQIEDDATLEGRRQGSVIGLSDDWKVTDSWLIHANARFYFIDEGVQFFSRDNSQVEEDFTSQSWHLGGRYDLREALTLKANVGRNIRIPYLFEKYGNSGAFEGNPDLSLEQADLVDGGFIYAAEHQQISASVFYKNISNGIYQLFDSRGVAHPLNVGKSELLGLEAEWRLFVASWFTLETAANLMDSVNNSSIKSHQKQKMPGIYHQNISMALLFEWRKWRFNNRIDVYDDLYYDLANSVAAERQTQLSSSLMFVLPRFSFDLSVSNMLDKHYMDYNRMPSPGRSFMATAHFKF